MIIHGLPCNAAKLRVSASATADVCKQIASFLSLCQRQCKCDESDKTECTIVVSKENCAHEKKKYSKRKVSDV